MYIWPQSENMTSTCSIQVCASIRSHRKHLKNIMGQCIVDQMVHPVIIRLPREQFRTTIPTDCVTGVTLSRDYITDLLYGLWSEAAGVPTQSWTVRSPDHVNDCTPLLMLWSDLLLNSGERNHERQFSVRFPVCPDNKSLNQHT